MQVRHSTCHIAVRSVETPMCEDPIAEVLNRAIRLAREKQREEARQLLLQVIERDERHEQAWLWLSGVVDDPADMQVALANVLAINPGNEAARRGLDTLRQRYGDLLAAEEAAAVPSPPAEEEEVIALLCYSCKNEVYSVADFCWQCHAVIHCCENCVHRRETACKERNSVRGPAAAVTRNQCPEWVPGR